MKIVSSRQSAAEPLEARIAPASLTFVDIDGDSATITTNKGTNAQLEAAADFLGVPAGPQQLLALNLGENSVFAGATVTIEATASGGDGFVNVGYINATGIDLAQVVVDGDLGRIDVGDRTFSTRGIGLLEVQSVGAQGVATQAPGGSLLSNIKGTLGSLVVHGNFKEAQFEISGSVGEMDIEGSILGGTLEKSGSIRAGTIKNVNITGTVTGGAGLESGRLSSGTKLLDATIGGGIVGGAGDNSGQLAARRELHKITVNGGITGGSGAESGALATSGEVVDVTINGNITGGSGSLAGEIAATGNITNVTLNGSVIGGTGVQSGSIGSDKAILRVHITGDVIGGTGPSAGQIVSKRTIRDVSIDGSLIGGAQFETGSIGSLLGLNDITIGKDVVAGTGERSGLIVCDTVPNSPIGSITVLGSIIGTPLAGIGGINSGGILGGHTIKSVEVGASILGGNGLDTGSIIAREGIKNVLVHGNVEGGSGESSGSIHSTFKVGTIVIDGDLKGGDGLGSGAILSATTIAAVTVHGSIIGGDGAISGRIETDGDGSAGNMGKIIVDGAVQGGPGIDSGLIFSSGALTSAQVGSLVGGSARGSGAIAVAGNIGTLVINGDVSGGTGDESGKILGGANIKKLTIVGSLLGGSGNYDTTIKDIGELGQIFAGGTIEELAVTSITGGSGTCSAQIRAAAIDEIVVNDSVVGGAGLGSASIIAEETDLGTVLITNDLSSGLGSLSGQIGAARKITSLSVGRTIGNDVSHVLITAGGALLPKNDNAAVAIKQLAINQSTSFTDILAGYDVDGNLVNPDAQISAVVVGVGTGAGDWTSTSVVAGVSAGRDGAFGTSDDGTFPDSGGGSDVLARIASVIIKGTITPADSRLPSYGIVAEHVIAVEYGGADVALQAGPKNDFVRLGSANSDTAIHEIGAFAGLAQL